MTEMPEMPEKNDKRGERFVDDLLDSALVHYAQAEPRPGLEGRVLARLRSEPAAFGWRWLPMAAAAAVVLAAVLYFAGSRESRPAQVAVQAQPVVAPTVTAPAVTLKASAPVAGRNVDKQPSAPPTLAASTSTRSEQFPTPATLSEQEQLLARFVSQASPRELQALARENRAEPIQELRVDALDIPPVVVGEAGSQ